MKMTISAKGGANTILKQLEHMKRFGIEKRIRAFLNACGDRGIQVARQNSGQYGSYIEFTKEVNGHTLTVRASDKASIPRQWVYRGTIKVENVSPLMLAEYGSGNFFLNNWDNGITRDTSIYESNDPMPHANDPVWWWHENFGSPRQYSSGEAPTMPMYNSYITLIQEIEQIAQTTLGNFDTV